MKQLVILIAAWAISCSAAAQNTFTAIVTDARTQQPLPSATVKFNSINRIASTDADGRVRIPDMPNGRYTLEIRFIGYEVLRDSVLFPLDSNALLVYKLQPAHGEELGEVIVSTTRSSRTIDNVPTRIEVIAGEELDEKANMKPGDIRMVLNESTGIQTQQTSATSANASIRIQGLDGRYTQILKDGFPLYSGASSGLGLLQIPPLDLKQVEVIKGSASTLYGGGAIAGLVNLISKTPQEERELNVHLNGTSAGGLDLNGFYSEKFGIAGLTVFASRNSNKAYDPSSLDLTAIPEFERYVFNPKLFLYPGKNTTLSLGLNSSAETRTGGDLKYIKGTSDDVHSYFERNKTARASTQFNLSHRLGKNDEFSLRNSISYFSRKLTTPGYVFDGVQLSTFSEANYSFRNENTEWVGGLNLWTDEFNEVRFSGAPLRDYRQTTMGAFIQNNVHATRWLEVETGLRTDYVLDYGWAWLPRISALIKVNEHFNSRVGGGLGYKAPGIFTEESERVQYQNVLAVSPGANRLEKSYGVNWDVNYRGMAGNAVLLSVNHMFFYTFLNNPLLMEGQPDGRYRFVNLAGHIDTRGMETNVKIGYNDFKLFLGYTFTDTKIHTEGILKQNPLTSRHRLNNVLMYELEEKWKLGAEAYYYGSQELTDGATGKPYWIFGFMAEKLWEKFSLYINFENFTDTRQTRFDTIYTGNISNPQFRDIYAPLDGFVVNGGVKIRF